MITYGVLGQVAPAATTLTTAYPVPVARHATVKVLACNRSTATTFRIAVSPGGESIANEHYIAYDQPLDANDSVSSVAVTVTAGDVVRVYSVSGNVSFTVTGIEDDNA
jgi:hypothetical protein